MKTKSQTLKMTLIAGILLASSAFAAIAERTDEINGVKLESGKIDSTRFYKGVITKTYPYSIDQVRASVMNFDERCNNEYKSKREYTDKTKECKFHNDNLVESVVIRDIKADYTKDQNEVDRFVIARRVYNRGAFSYNELVKVFEYTNSDNQKVVKINQSMIDDKEVKQYTKPLVSKDTAFDATSGTFILTQISANETKMDYIYNSETTHWILNKEVSVSQVFSSISKSLTDLIDIVEKESSSYSRDIASK
jgi:hypothetical protein